MTTGAGSLREMLDERRHLLEIARWMFDSAAMADRVVQETYRRWYALADAERAGITVPRAWLTWTAGAVCLELLSGAEPAARGGRAPVPEPAQGPPATPDGHDRVVRRFAAACEAGDTAGLHAVLAANAMVVSDGGGRVRAAVRPAHGADAVARFVTELLGDRTGTELSVRPVNGRSGMVLRRAGQAVAVVAVSVAGTEVTAVWIMLNPDKLRHWHLG
ncbi:hypothetical protein DP939_07850 [Spongiactinospora rosea]|uniref:Uncharacterized protein n=1 Tax=Spongiactinospora rosea TaxID=2248750 RepID=A0A366M5U0_9ACTN|nr:sigma factor [Spongiactinospora rosea]RBQ20964.1 hypothetical protein DP939_07850 [Spongiactinospora rosea]